MLAVEKVLQILASLVALTGVAPAFLYLDWQAQATILAALVAGFFGDRRKTSLLRPLPATLLSLLFLFFYLAQMSLNHIVEPLVNLLVLLLAVRMVTEKSGRNLLQIFVLSIFILAASSLLSLSLGYLASLIIFIILVTFGLLLTSFYATDPSLCLTRKHWLSLLRTGSLLPLGSLLLMIFFFAILPRTEHPLWHFLNPGPKPAAGFSELVDPGKLTDLGFSGVPAFRAEMAEIDPQNLYWRGLVLNQLEGSTWKRAQTSPGDQIQTGEAREQTQIIYSEARTDRYLPGLDLPISFEGIRHTESSDAVFKAQRQLNKRLKFTVKSMPQSSLQLKDPQESAFYLQTPAQTTQRVRAIADEIALQADRRAKIAATEKFFIQQKLSYATRNLQLSETPTDSFLFESRRGYCEYFASSFALLLRLSGVPTRLVGGYLGGRYNQFGGYYLIDEDMAHVWVEALDDNDHWQRIDPSQLAINAAEAVAGLSRRDFAGLQAASDYFENAWIRLVITYDLQKQLSVVFSAGESLRQLQPTRPGKLLWWLSIFMLPALALFGFKRIANRPDQHQRLLNRYLARLGKSAGVKQLPANIGLFKLAELSQEPLCQEFAEIFAQAAYREEPLEKQQIAQLEKIIARLALRPIQFREPYPSLEAQPHQLKPAEAMIDKSMQIP